MFHIFKRDEQFAPGFITVHARANGAADHESVGFIFYKSGKFLRGGKPVDIDTFNCITVTAGFPQVMELPAESLFRPLSENLIHALSVQLSN